MDANEKKIRTAGKEYVYRYKFCNGWLKMKQFQNWLKKSCRRKGKYDLAICKICDCTILAHKSCLLRHKRSTKHQKNETKMGISRMEEVKDANQNENTEGVKRARINLIAEDVKRAEMNLYSFIAEHKLSIQVADSLVSLVKNIFPDSEIVTKIASKRKTNTPSINEAVGNNLDILYIKLSVQGMFFSIKVNKSAITQCTLTVVFMDGENGVRYNFFDEFKFKVKSGSTKYLYSSLKDSILSRKIPLENLVGISLDTTDDMVKEKSFDVSYFQNDCPDIVCLKSFNRMIHLAASKACLKLPTNLEDFLKKLGSHFSCSYGKQESFKDFQEFFHVNMRKIPSPATTMWLSVKECVDRVLKQYVPLQIYLYGFCNDDPFNVFRTILDTMKNPFTVAYLRFLSYILEILSDFNIMFQAEKPLLHKMKPEVEKLLKHICFNFLQTDYVRKTPAFQIKYTLSSFFLPLDEIYIGFLASETMNNLKKMPNIKEKDIALFFNNILNFYVELITVMRGKFDFRNQLYNIISVVDPQVAQDFNIKSLVCVWKRFPILKKFINIQALDNEWKKHGLLDHHLKGLDPRMPADEYWQKVFQINNVLGVSAFPNLYTAMKLLLVLPFFPTQVSKESLAH